MTAAGDQVDVLVVPRWNPFRRLPYVPGSSLDWRCSICTRRVVLAPTSIRVRARQEVRIVCLDCMPGYINDTGVGQVSVRYL